MVIEEIVDAPVGITIDLASAVGSIGLWLKAVGILFVIYIIFHFVNVFISRKNQKNISSIKEDLKRIEEKIDKLTKKN